MEPTKEKILFLPSEYLTFSLVAILILSIFGGILILAGKTSGPSSLTSSVPSPSGNNVLGLKTLNSQAVPTHPPKNQDVGLAAPTTLPKATIKPTLAPSPTASASATPSPTPTATPIPTATPTPTPAPTPTTTPSPSPLTTATPSAQIRSAN